jgi:hypothetical protein
VSEELRVVPEEIRDYFEFFCRLSNLKVVAYKPYVRVFGDTAINDGYYVFEFDKDGTTIRKNARFTFVYRRNESGRWMITDHHSSLLPTAPEGLKRGRTVLLFRKS